MPRTRNTGPVGRFLCFVFVLPCLLPAPAAGQPSGRAVEIEPIRGQRWAVLVGVNEYTNLDDLKYCVADASKLRDELIAAGFPKENVFLLVDRADRQVDQPFRANIQQRIGAVLALAGKEDLVLVGFSGHGVHLDGKSYFCPAEADLESPQTTMVPLDLIYKQLEASQARKKLLLVDACRNDPRPPGEKNAALHDRSLKSLTDELQALPPGILALSSSAAGQISWEDAKLGHGVFMYYVMDGLSGEADAQGNRDGSVSMLELFGYANLQTRRWVLHNRPGSIQTPELHGKIPGDFELGRRIAPAPAVAPFNAADAKGYQQAWAKHLGQPVEITNSIGMKLTLIPPGEFMMGSPASEAERDDDEAQHRVRLTKPYYLGMYEVTQNEYERVMGTNPSNFKTVAGQNTSRFPVEQVSWEEAVEFCRKLSALSEERSAGRVYRLPTEAEWEFACRAGTTTPFHFGSQLNGREANCDGNYPYGTTSKGTYLERPTTVGSYGANGFGLFDMHGNAWEWCADWYDSGYYANSPVDDPTGPTAGSARVDRGGCWVNYAGNCRSANRRLNSPGSRSYGLGFRLASSSVDQSGQ